MDLLYFDPAPEPHFRAMILWLHEHEAEPVTIAADEEHLWSALLHRRPDAVVLSASTSRDLLAELRRRRPDVTLVVLTEGDAAAPTPLAANVHTLRSPGGPRRIRALLGGRHARPA